MLVLSIDCYSGLNKVVGEKRKMGCSKNLLV